MISKKLKLIPFLLQPSCSFCGLGLLNIIKCCGVFQTLETNGLMMHCHSFSCAHTLHKHFVHYLISKSLRGLSLIFLVASMSASVVPSSILWNDYADVFHGTLEFL